MLRLLLESNRKGIHYSQGTLPSLLAHSLLIAASVIGTRNAVDLTGSEEAEKSVVFLVPMNRVNAPPPREESVQFLKEGVKAGSGGVEEKVIDKKSRNEAPVVGTGPEEGKPEEAAEELIPNAIYDTVATAVDVDSMVTRYSDSAAPSYPPKLLELKAGTRIVSNSFDMQDWVADETSKVDEECSGWCTARGRRSPTGGSPMAPSC